MDLDRLLKEPTAENYLEALDELAQGEGYEPYRDHMETLRLGMMGQDYRKVLEHVSESASTLMLSPVAHHYAAKAATEIGDDERAGVEQVLLSVMMNAMLATGDGTRNRPYVISILADEPAVCGVKDFSPSTQQLVHYADRVLDVLVDDEGRELAFDITRIHRTLGPDAEE